MGISGYLSACDMPSTVHDPVDHRPHKTALGVLMLLVQTGVTEDGVIHRQVEGWFTFLLDARESRQDVQEFHFTAWSVSDCGIILLQMEKNALEMNNCGR